jgi:hypothetical protein
MENYYEILGVRPDATNDEIDAAYREFTVKLRAENGSADRQGAKQQVLERQKAYETLSHAERRFHYNAAHCRMKSGWFLVPMDASIGDLRFNSDGSFVVFNEQFSAEDPVSGKLVLDEPNATCTATKAAGAGELLTIAGPGVSHRYRHDNSRWYCWMPSQEAVVSAVADILSGGATQRERVDGARGQAAQHAPQAPPRRDPPPSHSRKTSIGWLAAVSVLFLAVAAGWLLNGLQHRGANPGTLEDRQRAADERAKQFEIEQQERQQQERELAASRVAEEAESGRKMDAARNRDRLLALVRRGEETLKLHDELVSETQAWQEAIPPLLTNDDGRKLATHPEYVRNFMTEYRKRRPSGDALAALRVEIEKLLAPLREAAADEDPAFSPPRDIDTALDQKHSEIDKALSEYRTSRSLITALIASTTERAPKTLTAAIDELVKADELDRAKRIAAATAETRRKRDELEADNARRKAEAELAHQTELARAADAEEARRAQKEQDRHDAESREVRAALGFFFAKDFLQPTRGPGYNGMEQTGKSGPLSFSRLESCGALSQDRKGLQTLLWIVTNTWDKSRPTWGVSTGLDGLSSADMQKLTQAQDYLNRLGPTLVEMGMLAE